MGSDRLGRGARSWGGHKERLPRAQPLSPDTTASLACLEAFTGDTHTKVERRKTTERRGQGRHHACDGHESARTSRQGHRTRGKMATTMEMNLMTACLSVIHDLVRSRVCVAEKTRAQLRCGVRSDASLWTLPIAFKISQPTKGCWGQYHLGIWNGPALACGHRSIRREHSSTHTMPQWKSKCSTGPASH